MIRETGKMEWWLENAYRQKVLYLSNRYQRQARKQGQKGGYTRHISVLLRFAILVNKYLGVYLGD
jgi:hypothetical protein